MNQHSTSTFGRGWIPMERDIGLPDDVDPFAHRRAGGDWVKRDFVPAEHVREEDAYASAPLPPAGGAGGGFDAGAAFASAHPNPSRSREGLYPAQPFTLERRVRFLHLLAVTGNVRRACSGVGVSPQSAYVNKRRDAAFAHGWDAALLLARDAAEEVLAERALNGVRETIFYRGEAVGSRMRFDGRLLLAHLARLDRHADAVTLEREAAPGIAARFDDYLGELLEAGEGGEEPQFRAPDDDLEGPPQWDPASPTREDAVLAARGEVLRGFPQRAEDLPPETLAEYDLAAMSPLDIWPAAFARARDAAELAAATAWDTASETRRAALDALFEGAAPPPAAPVGQDPTGEDPAEPPHSCDAEMGASTARAAGGEGAEEPPLEVKSRPSPQDSVNPVNRPSWQRPGGMRIRARNRPRSADLPGSPR